MDLFQLETFLAVVTERGFSRAAVKLFRTQPAVSQTIRKLEAEIGEPIFDRSARDGVLTDAGGVLRDYAERLLNLRTEAQEAIVDLREMQRGRLSIAANEFTCLYLLPVLLEFRRMCPMIHVAVQRSLASHIPEEVLKHSVELGVVSYKPEEPLIRSVVVYEDELVFVVHARHPLASAKEVSIHQLGTEVFVAHNVPSNFRKRVIDAFKRHNTPLHMSVELPTLEAIKKYVSLGFGVALVPRLCVESEISRGELIRVPIRELPIKRKLRIVSRKGAALSHAAQAFLKVAEKFGRDKDRPRYLFQPEK